MDNEGSSNAAQDARDQLDDTEAAEKSSEKGFFSRVFDGWGGSEDEEDEDQSEDSTVASGMVNLRRLRVEDVAVPKADIVAVPCTISRDELVDVFRETGMTRLPVYRGTLDTPVGLAHLKDFALKYGFNGREELAIDDILRPLVYVPPSMTLGVLLTKMQAERRHMALVIDEYGGVDGLVTIEDLIEQVIGDIEDEHDLDEGKYWTREKTGCYNAISKTPLDEFEAEIGVSLTAHEEVDEEEIDTLGGLVFMLTGRVPARGEVVVHPEGHEFEVIDADPRRIKRLRVRIATTDT